MEPQPGSGPGPGQAGAHVADTPAEAVDGAEVIVTMLADGDAVIASMEGADGP